MHAALLILDSLVGVHLMSQVYLYENNNLLIVESLIEDGEIVEEKQNDRTPQLLKASENLFSKGWKFDLFNTKGQVNKQINAAAVIFALLQFSIVGITTATSEAFCVIVLAYSLICLFSYFNLTYVRDFDAC